MGIIKPILYGIVGAVIVIVIAKNVKFSGKTLL